jgi:T-complex protein 1 subunit beta
MAGRIIPKIFAEEAGAHEEKGEHARLSSFIGAIAVADLVKTTLGPKGMDKILQSMSDQGGKCSFTNDGATILKAIPIDNAAAKIIVDTSKTQDEEVGDGTTSVAVLAGEFLRQAEMLVNAKIHPQIIIRGWRKALLAARASLEASALDNRANPKQFKEDLLNIARTTLSSKILSSYKDHFAALAVDAVLRLKGSTDLSSIQIVKKVGASLKESYLEEGFILDKKIGVGQPKRIVNARILVANTAMDTDKIKIYGGGVKVDSVNKVAEIEKAERQKMKKKVEKILNHNINVLINRQLIYNYPEQMFAEKGVMAIEHADFEGVERLALVLGADIVSTFDHPERVKLGHCDLIEEIVIGEDKVIRFSGVARGEACSIVLRGASKHILDEAERSLHDALCVLSQTVKNTRIVYGGGASEMLMANAVEESIRSERKEAEHMLEQAALAGTGNNAIIMATPGKEVLAIKAFARALRALPTIIADNGGYDSNELVAQLEAAHASGLKTTGLDMDKGTIGDMSKLKITESLQSKMMVLISAHEAAEMILRVDDIIKCAPRKRQERHPH